MELYTCYECCKKVPVLIRFIDVSHSSECMCGQCTDEEDYGVCLECYREVRGADYNKIPVKDLDKKR